MDTDREKRALHVLISGRVQGVGYRAWTRDTAAVLGVSGWVRNCRNGDVEAVFSGSETAIGKMFEACHNGPDWARVTEVRIVSNADYINGPLTILKDR